jgi:hypothetical protein
VSFAAAAAVVASLSVIPATPAQAQASCLTADVQTTHWTAGSGQGGFTVTITLTNVCGSPVNGWTLELTLPPGHAASSGWSAEWTTSGVNVIATNLPWNMVINPGQSITIGFVGSWTGAFQDPVSCVINGAPCDGSDPAENLPPEVTMTSPRGGLVGFVSPCPFVLNADASDPDGTVERVEFFVNGALVGTDHTAPYLAGSSLGAFPPPSPPSFEYVAFARAHDDGTPPLSTDSAPVAFRIAIGDPAPETIYACTFSLELPAGTAEPVRFGLFSFTVNEVTLTVTGDPGITVSPTTIVPNGSLVVATVSAAPGSAGATATITASAGDLRPATMSVTVS